tara:strand:- start:38331 stop:39218 length:888 start_codon:yes stop_codon:yes gene_type:complete
MVKESFIYINGEFKASNEANISILDQGFLLGDAVFDVVSSWQGVIFKLDQHIARFEDSLRAVRLNCSLNRDGWRQVIIDTVRQNNLRDSSIRFIATRGLSQEIIADPRNNKPTEIVWAAPYIFLADQEKRNNGVRLMISALRGFSPDTLDPRYKCVDRMHFQLAKMEALDAGYDDVIWLDQNGYIAEGPASNIFLVKNQVLFTPSDGVLKGITRETFLELADRAKIQRRECQISSFDLYSADEVFTTSTAGGALAVREVSGRIIGNGSPGEVTKKLDDMYWDLRRSGEYGTPVFT